MTCWNRLTNLSADILHTDNSLTRSNWYIKKLYDYWKWLTGLMTSSKLTDWPADRLKTCWLAEWLAYWKARWLTCWNWITNLLTYWQLIDRLTEILKRWPTFLGTCWNLLTELLTCCIRLRCWQADILKTCWLGVANILGSGLPASFPIMASEASRETSWYTDNLQTRTD